MSSGDILEQSGCEYLKCQYAGRKDGEPTCGYPGGFCPYRDDDNLELGEPDILPKVKPLRWRTGPVPEGEVVLYEYFLDGLGTDYEIGEGNASGDLIGNFHTEWKNARWLPLSEILALVEG